MLDWMIMVERRQLAAIDVRVLLLNEAGEALLLQRSDDVFPGHWNLPGGHITQDEDVVSAACRELQEETGVIVAPSQLRFVAICHYRISGRSAKVGFAFITSVCTCTPYVGEPGRFSAVGWFSILDPPRKIMPHASEILRLHASGLTFSSYGWH